MKYGFSGFSVDTELRELSDQGGLIALQPQAFALLVFLIENSDRVVTKDEIFEAVWQDRIVGDGTLNARINAIRSAVGDDGTRQEVIKTLPRQGFRFIARLGDPADATTTPVQAATKSVAVLPFTDIGDDPEQGYFADGLTEDLITDLAKVPDLFVIARNTSFSYKGSPKSMVEIGQETGVAHVLEGSVRRAGGRIRINAQLVATETGGSVWAERYDREFDDIFSVQDEITKKITTAMKASLISEMGRSTDNSEAYELSLKARALFFQFTPEANRECIRLLDRAIELDPDFAEAWAGLVFPYQSGYSFAWPGYEDGVEIAQIKARRAVKMGPQLALTHCRLGWVSTIIGDHKLALEEFERATELEPNNADPYVWYCDALNFAGFPERAIPMGEAALRFDPVAPPNVLHHLAHAHFLLGNLEEAKALELRAAELVPFFPPTRLNLAATFFELGDIEAAKSQIATLLGYEEGFSLARFWDRYPYANEKQQERIATALNAAGLT
ncbi:MAG: tetratricopeptide repeat protein [Silicimonas sp.]|nr:tetratricopeptide repeat protein [Silicimonas sp.]